MSDQCLIVDGGPVEHLEVIMRPPDAGCVFIDMPQFFGERTISCTYIVDPFEEMLDWLDRIRSGDAAATWSVNEEGSTAHLTFLSNERFWGGDGAQLVYCRAYEDAVIALAAVTVGPREVVRAFYTAFRNMADSPDYRAEQWELDPEWVRFQACDENEIVELEQELGRREWGYGGHCLRTMTSPAIAAWLEGDQASPADTLSSEHSRSAGSGASMPYTFLDRADRPRLVYHHRRASAERASAPTLVFLPGYASDMTGTKALALDAWAGAQGLAMLRFDYAGCGASGGAFEDQSLADWLGDALALIDTVVTGPVILTGSSMGGWLALLAALARPARVAGIIGIAAAPDFTMWGFSQDEKMTILAQGRLERASAYGPEPMVTTRRFWQSGEGNRVLIGEIALDCPVRLIHGQADADVPWQYALETQKQLRSADVQLLLIKDGDHRLSREADIALLIQTADNLVAQIDTL